MAAMAGKSISMFQGKRKVILQIFGILLPSGAEDPKTVPLKMVKTIESIAGTLELWRGAAASP
jgi:hypothetical protein